MIHLIAFAFPRGKYKIKIFTQMHRQTQYETRK